MKAILRPEVVHHVPNDYFFFYSQNEPTGFISSAKFISKLGSTLPLDALLSCEAREEERTAGVLLAHSRPHPYFPTKRIHPRESRARPFKPTVEFRFLFTFISLTNTSLRRKSRSCGRLTDASRELLCTIR